VDVVVVSRVGSRLLRGYLERRRSRTRSGFGFGFGLRNDSVFSKVTNASVSTSTTSTQGPAGLELKIFGGYTAVPEQVVLAPLTLVSGAMFDLQLSAASQRLHQDQDQDQDHPSLNAEDECITLTVLRPLLDASTGRFSRVGSRCAQEARGRLSLQQARSRLRDQPKPLCMLKTTHTIHRERCSRTQRDVLLPAHVRHC
jgi:hypothetical protein